MMTRLQLLFLISAALPLVALESRAGENDFTVRLIACEVTKEPRKVFLQTEAGKSAAFELPSSDFSEKIAVSGRSVALKSADDGTELCAITLPAEGKSFAVLLAPAEPQRFAPSVVRMDDDSFKAGDYFFVNRSAGAVVLKLGATEVVLGAGESVKSRPTEPVNNNHYNVTMSSRSEAGDKAFASSRWPLENGNRSYVMILTGPNGRITYRAVDEFVE